MRSARRRVRIHGIDFSGAARAGRKIWVASGRLDGAKLVIEDCRRGASLPGSGTGRDECLSALRQLIEQGRGAVFGLDFPFGLPSELVKERTWEKFVRAFGCRYCAPERFRQQCKALGPPERKRLTDVETKTPFSPYHLWLHRQTFFGIRDLLAPLALDRRACVLPMQHPEPGKPWVLEICPASTLKRLAHETGENLYIPYKGKKPRCGRNRERILGALETNGRVVIRDADRRAEILDDAEGDALDSVIAALGTARALRHPAFPRPDWKDAYAIEGYVYA